MLGEGGVTGDLKPWGRWATLGLGLIALFGGQMVALIVLIRWYGVSLTHWSDLETDGVLVTVSVCITTVVQVALLALMARQTGAGAAAWRMRRSWRQPYHIACRCRFQKRRTLRSFGGASAPTKSSTRRISSSPATPPTRAVS